MRKVFRLIIITALFNSSYAAADIFTHRQNNSVLHGYATNEIINGRTTVKTVENGSVKLNLSEYEIKQDSTGRNNKVAVISIEEPIGLEMETDAFEKAIADEANQGPLFILIEIDTPGGRVSLTKRICNAIIQTRNCQTVALITGGKFGGAYSGGAATALACDKIYVTGGTAIGAATAIAIGDDGHARDLKDVVPETIAEKTSSAWRNYMASLAQQNHRPGLLAKAMENKDIEVVEVVRKGKSLFIEPINKKPNQRLVRTWSRKGALLTLPAEDAVKCGIADKVVSSRAQLLNDLGAASANIVINTQTADARALFEKVIRKFNDLNSSIDLRFKKLLTKSKAGTLYKPQALKALRSITKDINYLIRLCKRYPDLEVEEVPLQESLNSVKALYETTKAMR